MKNSSILISILLISLFGNSVKSQNPCQNLGNALEYCEHILAPDVRALFVNEANAIIKRPNNSIPAYPGTFSQVNGKILINWAKANNFNYLILYKITDESPTDTVFVDQLANFIKRAHRNNIEVSINVASIGDANTAIGFLGKVVSGGNIVSTSDMMYHFDGIHFEDEYWNTSDTSITVHQNFNNTYLNELILIDSLCIANNLICETYIGNPSHTTSLGTYPWTNQLNIDGQEEIDSINKYTDRIFVTHYKSDPCSPSNNIFLTKKYRYLFLHHSTFTSDIVVLFNSNNHSSDSNMYKWLNMQPNNPGRWALPYKVWMGCPDGYNDDPYSLYPQNVNSHGYAWYRFEQLYELSRKNKLIKKSALRKTDQSDQKGIEEKELKQTKIDIYPNPVQRDINIEVSGEDKVLSIFIYSNQGQLLLQKDNINRISLGAFNPGTYVMKVVTTKESTSKRIIVSR